MKKISVDLEIIGIVHSPYKTTQEAPRQGTDEICEVEIFKEYEKGLEDIDGFSHFHLFYWLHKSQGYKLIVQTPWDEKPHGLFTTRSPHRPNPLAHSIVELVKRKENILKVKGLDAIDGTPVIDIKPYTKKLEIKKNAKSGWLDRANLK